MGGCWMFKLNFVYCLLLVGLTATSAHADIFRVDATAPSGGDGTTWATAFNDLQVAFDAARDNGDSIDEIWLCGGTYLPSYRMDEDPSFGEDGDNPRAVVLVPRGNVEVYGGFGGWETQRSDRDIISNLTVISGDLNNDDLPNWQNRGDNAYALFVLGISCGNATATEDLDVIGPVVLDGITIRGANNNEGYSACWRANDGIAIKSEVYPDQWISHRLTIRDCLVTDNYGDDPSNGNHGGIVDADCLPLTMERVAITDNWAEEMAFTMQGNFGLPSFVVDCTFARNGTTDHKLEGTMAYFGGRDGGTNDNYPMNLGTQVANCRFLDNHVDYNGGTARPHVVFDGKVRVNNCVFAGNSAGSAAGFSLKGAFDSDRMAIASNCLIIGNYTQDGEGGPIGTVGCGGVAMDFGAFLYNCIVWGNDGRDDDNNGYANSWGNSVCTYSNNWGGTGDIRSCLIMDMDNGTAGPLQWANAVVGCFDADPLFMNAAGDDGIIGTVDDDYRLGEGSPCIDRGNNEYVLIDAADLDGDGDQFELLTRDLARNYRFVDVETVPDLGTAAPGYPYIVDLGPLEVPACAGCPGERYWVADSGTWGDIYNWYPGLPGPANEIIFQPSSDITVTMDVDGFGNRLRQVSGDITLNAAGHTIELNSDVTESLILGRDSGDSATLLFQGGTLEAQAGMLGEQVGSAGTLSIGQDALAIFQRGLTVGLGGAGHLNVLHGGMCVVRDLVVGDSAVGSGSVLISGANSLLDVPFFMLIDNGTVQIDAGATLRVGVLGTAMFQDAVLGGSGTIESDVFNFGTLNPGDIESRGGGTLTIVGDFNQLSDIYGLGTTAGTVLIDAGLDGYDQLSVTGTASLSGGLRMVAGDTWDPASGTEFAFLQAADVDGRFDVAFMPGLGDDRFAKLVYPGEARGDGSIVTLQIDDFENIMGFDDPDSVDLTDPPSDLVVTDLNGDTFADVALSIPGGSAGSILVLFSDGAGGFSSSLQINVGTNPVSIAAGDVDGDGYVDLATANAGSGGVSIVMGAGNGTFGSAADTPTGTLPSCVLVMDTDADNAAEVIVLDEADGTMTVLSALGLRDTVVIPLGDDPVFGDPSDDEDQKNWFGIGYTTRQAGTAGMVVKTRGVGGWTVLPTVPVGTTPTGLDIVDLNADGVSDFVVTGADGVVSILLIDEAHTFSPAVLLPIGSETRAPVSIDFDIDGDNDVVLLSQDDTGTVSGLVLRNDSNLADFEQLLIAPGDLLDLGGNPVALGAGDLDGDGLDDVLAINGAQNLRGLPPQLLSVANASTPPSVEPCPGDADGDDVIDIEDLLVLLSQWGACSGCEGDFDDDGIVDIEDLLIMLSAWGPCTAGP